MFLLGFQLQEVGTIFFLWAVLLQITGQEKKKASNALFEKTILLKDFILLIKISWRPQVSA